MAASAPFALYHLLSFLPFPCTVTRPPPPTPPPPPPPTNTPLLPLCPPSSSPLPPLSFRPRPTPHRVTIRPAPVSLLLPTRAEASEVEKGGAFGRWFGPSPPAEVLFACHPAAALANVLYAKAGYYNVKVEVAEDEPDDLLAQRFRRACIRAGVFRECHRRRFFEDKRAERKRRTREAAVRRAREAARLRRIAGVPQITGGFNSPFPQRGKKRRKKKKKEKRPQLRETPADDEEEEDNWEFPEGEIPYCR